jgi:hypothetical protein
MLKAEGSKTRYHVQVSSGFAALGAKVDNNNDEKNINISAKGSLGHYEQTKHKPPFEKNAQIIRSKETC